jgi:hypothetical protein
MGELNSYGFMPLQRAEQEDSGLECAYESSDSEAAFSRNYSVEGEGHCGHCFCIHEKNSKTDRRIGSPISDPIH